MDDGAVGLGGCFRRHRTQQRQASVDVVVGKAGENLGGGLISDAVRRRVAQRGDTCEERDGVVDLLAGERRAFDLDQLVGDGQGVDHNLGSERALDGEGTTRSQWTEVHPYAVGVALFLPKHRIQP